MVLLWRKKVGGRGGVRPLRPPAGTALCAGPTGWWLVRHRFPDAARSGGRQHRRGTNCRFLPLRAAPRLEDRGHGENPPEGEDGAVTAGRVGRAQPRSVLVQKVRGV